MRSLAVDILSVGAVIAVQIGVSSARRKALRREGIPVPPIVSIDLLIDTGATCTLIDTGVTRTLGLEIPTSATQYTSTTTRGVPVDCDLFDVELTLGGQATEKTWRIEPLLVMADTFINEPFSGLLGRDILDRAQLEYNGRTRRCVLVYE